VDDSPTALADAAASTIVQAMSQAYWPAARDRMAHLLGQAGPEAVHRAAGQLDDWYTAVTSRRVSPAEAWQQWQGHLLATMDRDPRTAGALSALVTEFGGGRSHTAPPAQRATAPVREKPPHARRRSRLGIGAWIGIAAVPVVLAVATFVIVALVADRGGSTYGVGDCVILEWQSADPVGDAFVALGKASCRSNVRGDGTYRVTRVERNPTSPTEYCDVEAAAGAEAWFKDDAGTLYCVVD